MHRAWSKASGKLLPESDAEYLARLRLLAHEREQLRNKKSATMPAAAAPKQVPCLKASGPISRVADDLRDALEAAEELAPATVTPALLEGAIDQARSLMVRLMQIRDADRRD